MGVVRALLAIICALVASALASSLVLSLVLGAFIDTGTQAGKDEHGRWLGAAFLAGWVVLAVAYWRSQSGRRIFGWMFLTGGLSTLAFPVATAAFSAAFVSRQRDALVGVGAAAGGTVLTLGVGVISFFFGAILLVIAFLLLSGGRRPGPLPEGSSVASATALPTLKKCPDCAEMVQADARICRFCRHVFSAAETPNTWSDRRSASIASVAADASGLRRASFVRRLVAYVLDVVGIYITILVLWFALGQPGGTATNALGALYLVGLPSYFLWCWIHGATLGMKVVGIRVVVNSGQPPELRAALARLVGLALVQAALFSIVGAVVFLVFRALHRPYWHDQISKTAVVMA